jgi:hypothetical protein
MGIIFFRMMAASVRRLQDEATAVGGCRITLTRRVPRTQSSVSAAEVDRRVFRPVPSRRACLRAAAGTSPINTPTGDSSTDDAGEERCRRPRFTYAAFSFSAAPVVS